MDLKELLKAGRGQLLETMAQPQPDELAESLVAFANADGGTVLLGVNAAGAVAEQLPDEHLEAILLRAQMLCHPPVETTWQSLGTGHGLVTAIQIPRSTQLHSLQDGRILLRSGARNRPLSGEEVRHLAATKGAGDYELEPITAATSADLDDRLIAEHLRQRRERGPRGEKQTDEQLLAEMGALDPKGVPTVAGLLLYGRNPQRFLPQSGAVFVRFQGTDVVAGGGSQTNMQREELAGPVGAIIEGLWAAIWNQVRHESVVSGLKREDRPEYPQPAVREAVVNAVAHRDYRIGGRRIEVRMFDDRLEIVSPGGLPGHITLDNIVEEHFSRNPRLVRGLFYAGFIEELGLGIDRMIHEMIQAGHPRPHFEAQPFTFKVTLRNVRERAASKWTQQLNERQIRALAHIEADSRITNREYHELCPDVTPETLRLDLADMVDKGILLRIGDKKGTYYILK